MLHRRISYYSLLTSYMLDAYHSKAETMMHLTLWSWFLQTLYFELPLPADKENESSSTPPWLVRLLHGPAFTGAHALFGMYLWTLYANPNMEFDLAPAGRPAWVVVARAAWLHAAPVVLQWIDLLQAQKVLKRYVYDKIPTKGNARYWWLFWSSVGGYFAMGLTWEQVNGDAAGTYRVTKVSPETYVAVSKAVGVLSCLGSFFLGFKPLLMSGDKENEENKTKAQ